MHTSESIYIGDSFKQFENATSWLFSDPLENSNRKIFFEPRRIPQTLAAYIRAFGNPAMLNTPFGSINFWNLHSLKIYLMDFETHRIVHMEALDLSKYALSRDDSFHCSRNLTLTNQFT